MVCCACTVSIACARGNRCGQQRAASHVLLRVQGVVGCSVEEHLGGDARRKLRGLEPQRAVFPGTHLAVGHGFSSVTCKIMPRQAPSSAAWLLVTASRMQASLMRPSAQHADGHTPSASGQQQSVRRTASTRNKCRRRRHGCRQRRSQWAPAASTPSDPPPPGPCFCLLPSTPWAEPGV